MKSLLVRVTVRLAATREGLLMEPPNTPTLWHRPSHRYLKPTPLTSGGAQMLGCFLSQARNHADDRFKARGGIYLMLTIVENNAGAASWRTTGNHDSRGIRLRLFGVARSGRRQEQSRQVRRRSLAPELIEHGEDMTKPARTRKSVAVRPTLRPLGE